MITKLSLFKPKRSQYYYLQYTINGVKKQESTGEKLKSKAMEYLANKRGKEATEAKVNSTLEGFKKRYIEHAEARYAPGTVDIYKRAFDSFIKVVGNINTDKVTAGHISDWQTAMLRVQTERRAGKRSSTYLNMWFRSLKHAFNEGRKWKLVVENPFLDASMLPTSDVKPAFLTPEQAKALLAASPVYIRDFIDFALNTGCRSGEIRNLTWDHVSFKCRYVKIRNTANFRTKHGKERDVPLNDAALRILVERHAKKKCEYVFPNIRNKRLEKTNVTHAIKRAMRAAGLPEEFHAHSLRHSAASFMAANGVPIKVIQEILGHSSIVVTQIYTHNTAEGLHRGVAMIPNFTPDPLKVIPLSEQSPDSLVA